MAPALLPVLALVLFAGTTYAASLPGRIVGGQPTTIDQYPSICQVEGYNQFLAVWSQTCAANILTTRYVLSAAHCFVADINVMNPNRRIRAGTTFRNVGGVINNCVQRFNHPNHGQLGADADISVILLEFPLTYTPVVQQGTIIAQDASIPDNLPVVHAGWGTTSQGGLSSDVLNDVTIYTINNQLCRERYLTLPNPGIVTENMICAGLLDVGGRDACQGDSGGPLYYGDIIIGIVSWGHGCANETYPGISTAVASYTNWIIQTAV